MLNYQTITEDFFSLVGLRQTEACNVDVISDSLTFSDSYLYANDLARNWLTNEKISLCIADYKNSPKYAYQAWNNATNYTAGQKVVYQGFVYEALQNNVGVAPDSDPLTWKQVTELPSLSKWLKEIKESAIQETLNRVLAQNNEMNSSYSIAPDSFGSILQGSIKTKDISSTDNKFFGYWARPVPSQGSQLEVKRIGLEVDTVGSFNFYIFHSSQPTAIKTFTINVGAGDINKFTWFEIIESDGSPCILNYNNNTTNSGGDYYLGIFRNEFNGLKEFDLGSYSPSYRPILQPCAKYFNFIMTEVDTDGLNGTDLFDVGKLQFGKWKVPFNLEVFASEDHTYVITRGKRLWASAIQHAIAIKILSEMMASTEIGRIASNAVKNINFILNGDNENKIKGLKDAYDSHINKLIKEYECTDGFEKNESVGINFY